MEEEGFKLIPLVIDQAEKKAEIKVSQQIACVGAWQMDEIVTPGVIESPSINLRFPCDAPRGA